jgi:integrase
LTTVKLKHVDHFVCRHGHSRYYFRRGKGPRTPLPGKPGTQEFMAAYQEALHGGKAPKPQKRPSAPSGTFDALVRDYYQSTNYLALTTGTQRAYRGVIDRLLRDEKIGHRQVAQMTRKHVQQIVARRAATPGAANDVLKKLKILVHFAIDNGWRSDDPTLRIKKFAEGEFHSWTDDEIATYERCWPIGTRERTAFALLLYTGQRVSDVAPMSRSDVENAAIRVVQGKTGAKLWIPLHPDLRRILGAWTETGPFLVMTGYNKRFSSKGLSNYVARQIGVAQLPDRCVAHGIRKAAARRLAEAGCSANEIAAITGHASLEEVTRYTKAAEQKRLARSAIDRLAKQSANEKSQPQTEGWENEEDSALNINNLGLPWRPVGESNSCFSRERAAS